MMSKKEAEKNEKIVRSLMRLPPNKICMNCNSLGTQYVCTTFSTFVCITCSGIHREFNHRVKSVSMATFTKQEVISLQNGGNARAGELFLKDWDRQLMKFPDKSNANKIREFINDVYVHKKYVGENASGNLARYIERLKNHEEYEMRACCSQTPLDEHQHLDSRIGKSPNIKLDYMYSSSGSLYSENSISSNSSLFQDSENSSLRDILSGNAQARVSDRLSEDSVNSYFDKFQCSMGNISSVNTSSDLNDSSPQFCRTISESFRSSPASFRTASESFRSSPASFKSASESFLSRSESSASALELIPAADPNSDLMITEYKMHEKNEDDVVDVSLLQLTTHLAPIEEWATFDEDEPAASVPSSTNDGVTNESSRNKATKAIENASKSMHNLQRNPFESFVSSELCTSTNDQLEIGLQQWHTFDDSTRYTADTLFASAPQDCHVPMHTSLARDDPCIELGPVEAEVVNLRTSTNPFDLPYELDLEASNEFLYLSSLQPLVPSLNMPNFIDGEPHQQWLPQSSFTQEELAYMAMGEPGSISSFPGQSYTATRPGNPFA